VVSVIKPAGQTDISINFNSFTGDVNDYGVKAIAADSISRSYDFSFSTRENTEKNGEHVVVHTTSELVADTGGIVTNAANVGTSILDPHTGVIYAITGKPL